MSADNPTLGVYPSMPWVVVVPSFVSLETVVISVQHRADGGHFIRKQGQVEFHVALLDHAAQSARRGDAAAGLVDRRSVTTDLALVAGHTLVISDQLRAELKICPRKNGRALRQCRSAGDDEQFGDQKFEGHDRCEGIQTCLF